MQELASRIRNYWQVYWLGCNRASRRAKARKPSQTRARRRELEVVSTAAVAPRDHTEFDTRPWESVDNASTRAQKHSVQSSDSTPSPAFWKSGTCTGLLRRQAGFNWLALRVVLVWQVSLSLAFPTGKIAGVLYIHYKTNQKRCLPVTKYQNIQCLTRITFCSFKQKDHIPSLRNNWCTF